MKFLTSIVIASGLLSTCLAATVRFRASNSSVSVLQKRTDTLWYPTESSQTKCNTYTMKKTTPDDKIVRNDCMVALDALPNGYWDVFVSYLDVPSLLCSQL